MVCAVKRSSIHPRGPAGLEAGAIAIRPDVLTGLDSKVLVLNRVYVAIRVISARRAFSLLSRDLAEVIHVDQGRYLTYDFAS